MVDDTGNAFVNVRLLPPSQVRNEPVMDANRRLALAQTYQMRSDALQSMVTTAAASSHLGAVIVKLTEAGYPEDISALGDLSNEERGRFRLWQIAQQTHWDNMHFQHQQGFLDEEYFTAAFEERVARLAPTWAALGLTTGLRRSFAEEIDALSVPQQRDDQP